jgi:hypothetical protein
MASGSTEFEQSIQDDGTMLFWGTELLIAPSDANHVRACSLFLPPLPKNNSMTATIYSPNSTGTMFAIWSMKKIYEKDYTQIAIHAANVQIGCESDSDYFIDWQVLAKTTDK